MRTPAFGAAALLFSSIAGAQTLDPARFDQVDHLASVGVGVDGPMVTELGYALVVPVSDRRVAIPLKLTLPLRPSFGDLGLSAGVQSMLVGGPGFGLAGRFDLSVAREETVVATFTKTSAALSLMPGYFHRNGSFALEFAWERGLFTRVSPSDEYRKQAYPDAHATWMGFGNGFLRIGLQGVVRIVGKTELSLRAGMAKTDHLQAMDLLPFYATLGIHQGF